MGAVVSAPAVVEGFSVELTLGYRGAVYATQEEAEAVLARFVEAGGCPVDVRWSDEALVIVTAERRGVSGAYRVHSLASAAGIPVSCS